MKFFKKSAFLLITLISLLTDGCVSISGNLSILSTETTDKLPAASINNTDHNTSNNSAGPIPPQTTTPSWNSGVRKDVNFPNADTNPGMFPSAPYRYLSPILYDGKVPLLPR
jgi:hypothetical protein